MFLNDGTGQLAGIFDRDTFGYCRAAWWGGDTGDFALHGGIVRGFHPDQADGRIDGFGCDSDTSHQTAAADGYDDRVDIRLCQHHFQADGALASNDVRSS